MNTPALAVFQGYGIELEYMIVDRGTLSPLSIADQLLTAAGGENGEVERGTLGWSNELVMHVVEIKNRQPSKRLENLPAAFQTELDVIDALLPLNACLMPAAMHPWMDPARDARIWPHHNAALYRTYADIFDCRTHGWTNLQSMHLNLPFDGDAEFARLHEAVRLVLPILPALAASSPFADGRETGYADFRMENYRSNAGAFASIAGQVVPEPVRSEAEYREKILAPMYREIASHDPDRLLQHEWLNSRGAIPRFERNAIEIRVIDTQECVQADLAIAAATVALIKALYEAPATTERAMPTAALADIMLSCIREGERAAIDDGAYLELLGYPGQQCTAAQLWRHVIERAHREDCLAQAWRAPLEVILEQGTLARRLLRAAGPDAGRGQLEDVYRQLCECLRHGAMFEP
jgi:carboxylate-amine ligase